MEQNLNDSLAPTLAYVVAKSQPETVKKPNVADFFHTLNATIVNFGRAVLGSILHLFWHNP